MSKIGQIINKNKKSIGVIMEKYSDPERKTIFTVNDENDIATPEQIKIIRKQYISIKKN